MQPQYALHPLIDQRYSPRAFSEAAVPEEALRLLLEAARRSPSSGNGQPWRFVVARRHTEAEKFAHLADLLMGNNRVWAPRAPILLLTCAHEVGPQDAFNRYAHHDVGMAMAYLTVQAQSMHLYVHQMGGFDLARAKKELTLPENVEPVAMAAIGYLGNPEANPENMRSSDLARTPRKTMEEILIK